MARRTWTVGVAALVVLVVAARAQYQGRVSGRVLDASGAAVEKAEVTIVSQRTASVRFELRTDKDGRFLQIGLMPGDYLVTVKKTGFAPAMKDIHVGIAGEEVLEVRLVAADVAMEKALSSADKAFLKGNRLYAEQKFAEAASAYEEAVSLDPSNWGYRFNLGLALKKRGKPEEALAAFLKAAELNPSSAGAHKEAGESLAKSGRFEEAKPFYEKAAALSPGDADVRYNLGVCLVNTGEPEAALESFRKAVELDPNQADAYYQMGTILIGQNKLEEARSSLERFLALAPDHEKAGIAKQLLEYLKK